MFQPECTYSFGNTLGKLSGKLVVSCQAAPTDPLEETETIRRIARAVVQSGAAGLRINSPEHVRAIRQDSAVPIIAIQKRYFQGSPHITPDFASASALAAAGASIIALDCTDRVWPEGDSWQVLIRRVHNELKLPVMADVSTLEEAVAAATAGADMVGTTLNGYTEATRSHRSFNWQLLREMLRDIKVPVIAEGHISSPEEARRALALGAWCVIVGSAITRPGMITAGFARALDNRSTTRPAIGIDIGGTAIKAAVIDSAGEVSLSTQVPTNASLGRDAIASGVCEAVQQVLSAGRKQGLEFSGLGIATAGAVEAADGSIFAATDNLPGWAGFQLRSFAEQRFGLPAWVLNDAHAAVLAELHFGIGRSLSDFVAITIGTGIGGGVVCNGKLLRGQYGFAGSVGHHVIRMGGRDCNCGRQGCLEAYLSTAALIREWRERGGSTSNGLSTDDATLARHINELAQAGSPAAVQAYDALGEYLAEGVANIFNLFDPEAVIVSGGLVEGQPQWISKVEKRVRDLLHFGAKRKPQVLAANAGLFAGVRGAAALVFEQQA